MFERFTDRARRVVVLAQEEARLLGHNYIGTEHLLLGLIHEQEGVAAKVLESLGISLERTRAEVEKIVRPGASSTGGQVPFTPRAKKVLELSLREALELGHNYIGTEHMLLGLLREGEAVAAQVLVQLGAERSTVRQKVIQFLSASAASVPRVPPPVPRQTPAGGQAAAEARRLAGAGPVGSDHYLRALVTDEHSLAARALTSLGVSREQVEKALRQAERTGTSDETPEEVGARALRLVVADGKVRLEIEDAGLLATLLPLVERGLVPSSLRGGDALTPSFPQLWTAVRDSVHDIGMRASATGEADPPT